MIEEEISFDQFELVWNLYLGDQVAGMSDLIKRLKKRGLKVAALSNTNPIHFEKLVKDYPIFQDFDFLCPSHHAKGRKPEKEIYQYLKIKLVANIKRWSFLTTKKKILKQRNSSVSKFAWWLKMQM